MDEPETRYWVEWHVCKGCGLKQIVNPIHPDQLYCGSDTNNGTGYQKPKHLDDLIATVMARQEPGRAIDIGCSDGALMEKLQKAGYETVGLEPNGFAALQAEPHGRVVIDYLTGPVAEQLGVFDTVFCRHVVEHVADLDQFFRAIRLLLTWDGIFVLELPENHPAWEEHVSDFTKEQAERLLKREGFDPLDFRRYAFGGGSMAWVCRRIGARKEKPAPDILEAVLAAKNAGASVVLYGAGPRSVISTQANGIAEMVDVVLDDRKELHGRLFPGTDVPVMGPLIHSRNDFLCLLGVGKQAEHSVKKKMREAAQGRVDFLSLPC